LKWDYGFQRGDCEGKERRGIGKAFTQVLTVRAKSLIPVARQKWVNKGRGERVGVLLET
jgi:hypothetical protein